MLKLCSFCGKMFDSKHGRKYCNNTCRAGKYRASYERKPLLQLICPGCNKEFTQKTSTQRHCCSRCQTVAYGKLMKKNDELEVKRIEKNVKRLNEVNHEAKLAGMSYGQYMAQKNKVTIERKW